MRRSTLSLVLLLIFFFPERARSQDERGLTLAKGVAAHQGIDSVYITFAHAYRALDPSIVAGLYAKDAYYLIPSSPVVRGRDSVAVQFQRFFTSVKDQGSTMSIVFEIIDRGVSGPLAYDVGFFTLTTYMGDGSQRSGKGKFNVVMRLEKDGRWRFHVDSYSDIR